jgi:hypothetical protein
LLQSQFEFSDGGKCYIESDVKLEARLVEFEENPEAGYSLDQVKSRLKDGSWRTV